VQSTLGVLLHRLPLERIAALIAAEPARRFGIAGKGGIVPGNDADLVLVDLAEEWTLAPEHLLQRHAISPYVGTTFRGRVRRTIRRGESIYTDGRITAQSNGCFIRPERN
jgi:allantoinase